MSSLVGVLCFIGAAVGWSFFNFPPEYANKRALSVFNWAVVGALAMICIAYLLNMKVLLSAETLKRWRVPFEVGGVLGIETCWLGIMFLVRNFWIFKPRRPRGW